MSIVETIPVPAVGYSGAGFFEVELETKLEFVMARIGDVYRIWTSVYVYCKNCDRPRKEA